MFHKVETKYLLVFLASRFKCLPLLKSRTSDKRRSKHVFISGVNPHLVSRFYKVVLDPTTISNMVLELIDRATHHLYTRTKFKSVGREGHIEKTQVSYKIERTLDESL